MVRGYDRPYAHPVSSFNKPVPLIDESPDEGDLVSVCFNGAYLPYILGAMSQLELQTTWDTDDPEAIRIMQEKISTLMGMMSDGTCTNEMVEAPFWDNAENVDDEEELGEQTWYVAISDIIIEGALAILLTPAAAVAYKATIPRIRLAFKTHNLGTIARVLFGAVDVFFDTFSPTPEIKYLELDYGSSGLDEYELRVENTGEYVPVGEFSLLVGEPNLQVVRGDIRPVLVDVRQSETDPLILQKTMDGTNWEDFAFLPPQTLILQPTEEPCLLLQSLDGGHDYEPVALLNECMPTIQVIVGEGGGFIVQTSPDGGTTWVNQGVIYTDPIGDTPPPQTPQPSDPKCNAARNATLAYYSMAWKIAALLQQSPPLEPYLAAAEVIPALRDSLNYFIGSNVFSSIVGNVNFALAVAAGLTPFYNAAIVGGGTTGDKIKELTDYDSGFVQSDIQCAIFCATDDEGNVDYGDAINELNALVGDGIQQGAVDFIVMLGAGGMSAAASARITTVDETACEDCTDCLGSWCYVWETEAEVNANWTLWLGAQGTRSVAFEKSFAESTVTSIGFAYTWNGIGGGGTAAAAIWKNTLETEDRLSFESGLGAGLGWTDELGQTMDKIYFAVNADGMSDGILNVFRVTITGLGESPFGESNC